VKFECQAPLHKRQAPPHKRKTPLLTTFWRRFCCEGRFSSCNIPVILGNG